MPPAQSVFATTPSPGRDPGLGAALEGPDVADGFDPVALDHDAAAVAPREEQPTFPARVVGERAAVPRRVSVMREELEVDEAEGALRATRESDLVLVAVEGRIAGESDMRGQQMGSGRHAGQHATTSGVLH